jgi:hypothetical protein
MRSVRQIGDELYAVAPSAFTAARDEQVAQAREQGDRALASELAALKRPTQAAWLVNVVALRRPELVTELLELGEAMRSAQGTVPPAQLRDLSAQRRRALDAALAAAGTLAAEAGEPTPARAVLAEAEATFAAAMADESAVGVVRAGRVLKPLRYSGFGGADFGSAAPARASARPPAHPRSSTSDTAGRRGGAERDAAEREAAEAAEREAEQRRAGAQARVTEAEADLDAAMRVDVAARERVDALTERLLALNEELDGAQRAARTAHQDRAAAERALQTAMRRLAKA